MQPLRTLSEVDELWAAARAAERVDLAAAERIYTDLLTAAPECPTAWLALGGFHYNCGRLAEAEKVLRQALNRSPPGAEWEAKMRFTIAIAQLATGRDALQAWEGMRWRTAAWSLWRPSHAATEWRGGPLKGRLFVLGEQGLGDEIHFARYGLELARAGLNVTYVCSPILASLFRDAGLAVHARRVENEMPEMADGDRWVMAFDVPARAKLRLRNLPPAPYLQTPEAMVMRGRIGVMTKGNAGHPQDYHRSLPPEAAERLLALDGALSLHPHDTGALGFGITAKMIAGLDLVITVDTAVAHLAGAMGKPVWILLPAFATDWRWGREGDRTPWYPSARLYRQEVAGDWAGVLDRVEADLQR